MKKIILGLLFLAGTAKGVFAQDEFDALRYSFTTNHGTARGMSIGGALGSLGGDFSTLSVNPAGIGIYRKSEFSFSPSFQAGNNQSTYLGTTSDDQFSRFNFASFGFVITSAKKGNAYKKSPWKSVSFGFGMNKLASFRNDYTYSGKNYKSSIVERWSEEFNKLGGLNENTKNQVSYPAFAAYQTWLIDKDYTVGGDSSKARSYVPYQSGLQQTKRVREKGGMNEYVISAGGNFQEKLLLGATLGISSVNYDRDLYIDEEDISGNANNDFGSMNYNESLQTTGIGINLKLGAIYKPTNLLRFGLALHTPTHIELNDVSSIYMKSNTDSFLLRNGFSNSPITEFTQDTALSFNYSLNTPYKALASATVLFKQYGFFTADVEYVNYASMRYNLGEGYEKETDAINSTIKNTYQDAINVRLGIEGKLNDFSVRAGYAFYGSPYEPTNNQGDKSMYCAGIGYRTNTWFLDAAYIYSSQTYSEKPYVLGRSNADVQSATIQRNTGNAVLTLGWKF